MIRCFSMSQRRRVLLLSSSRLAGYKYLEHAKSQLNNLFETNNVRRVLFVPYAQQDHDKYTKLVADTLNPWGYQVEGLHTKSQVRDAVKEAQAIFIGGGNTFVLLKALYDLQLIELIREEVLQRGLVYVGSSAGTNVATCSIHTTNDMPVAYPPTFDALGLVPFNINAHYIETDPKTEHKGETRDERLLEFLAYHRRPVLGLREGASLLIEGDKATLIGQRNAKLFRPSEANAAEYLPNSDLSFLLKIT